MPYFIKPRFAHQIGTRAAQPAAADVAPGTLYSVTDESVVERSNGATWDPWASGGAGAPGAAGAHGPPGLDALGDEPEIPYIIPGPPGSQGPAGAPGSDGAAGAPGATGATGAIGSIGPAGLDAEDLELPHVIPGPAGGTGASGSPGATGAAGAPGPPGLDADEIEMPYIIPGPQGVAGGGGGASYTAFTKDLGAARRSGTFEITGLAGLTADKVVAIVQTAAPISSKGDARDEPEMDQIQATGYVVDGSTIRAYWQAPSVVVGTYAFAYVVSA